MRQETFTLSAKELQRVAVISHCVKGDLACAGAAELLDLSPRQVKRLKSRYRQGGEAAMAHASRGRPSPRRLPEPLRQSILHLARTRYRGFNDHHLCEKLTEQLAGRRQPTQFGRALQQLGITYIPAHSPQAKGRIERLWGVLQDRLVSELRLARASNLASANQALRRFVADYNRRLARPARDAQTAWRPAPKELDRICCFVHERIVSNDNVVQWEGRRFHIPPQPRRFSFAGAKVQLYQGLDGCVALFYGDTPIEHTTA